MASRKLTDLMPVMQMLVIEWQTDCVEAGIELLIYCTLRPTWEQADLYALGRTKPGKIVTFAKPGSSAHNYGLALDFVPMIAGRPQWSNKKLYGQAINLAEARGLHSLRNDKRFPELAHLQFPKWREQTQ
jgi:peptidoglycan LD-endopeptidase CwlK